MVDTRGAARFPLRCAAFQLLKAMKKSLQASKQLPAWQNERRGILHRACRSLNLALVRGRRIGPAARRIARRFNGRPYRSEPRRHVQMSAPTLRWNFKQWQQNGRSASAFRLNYNPGIHLPGITASQMARFIRFSASRRLPTLKQAVQRFTASGHKIGYARPRAYDRIGYYFRAAKFSQLQQHIKAIQAHRLAIQQHEKSLAKSGAQFRAETHQRLPARLPQRMKGSTP
jgi:hypothetical protein